MTDSTIDRRRFDRIATDKPVVVTVDDNEYHGTVLDVSLHGMLLSLEGDWHPVAGMTVGAKLRLDDDQCCIDMRGNVVHVKDGRLGLLCTSMDVESASRLKRMVELNLADPALLERNLTQLIAV
ncbi:MAG: PilZ domain-containing protein [Gammaproteobacteria bacterium]|nr:PilZ domain-containing protein [Gammaproteobacteria bacterium]